METIQENELKNIWNMVFNLSLNFLHNEDAAEEATQEVFAKVCDSISSFRNESSLSTWVYRIAYNYLIDQTRLHFKEEISFEMFEKDINNFEPFVNDFNLSESEIKIYVEQVKIGCTKAMLQCLGSTDRFVFIIGKLFDFNSKDGSIICNMTDDVYRKRLSRATKKNNKFYDS